MKLKNMLEDQMATALWFFRFPPPRMAILAPSLILIALMGFGFFSIFLITSMVLILSTDFFTFSKQKPILVKNLVEEKVLIKSDQRLSPCLEDVPKVSKSHHENETAATQKEEAQEQVSLSSPDLISESECLELDHLSTSDESEVDWSFGENVIRSLDCSDGSISDEDSLIEIALPGGYYVGGRIEQESIFNLHEKTPGLSQQPIFHQHTLLELLAEIKEMNEEENLIEIDLSMGSIKCSRFEIEA